ncbi:lipopolysaccharide assembly protein LapA domain-containing protein [Nocardia sp. NPDC024068]|uniref:LapA family protein n=1 Tax=Nocardia sp. NPDC024068 TaxID=3157197 RepID=UPI0033E9E874
MATSDDRTPETGALPKENQPPPGTTSSRGSTDPAATGGDPTGLAPEPYELRRSRVGITWIALIVAALLGIVLLIFIIQNSESADVEMLFWSFSLPLGVTILLSVIAGALVMALVGGVRIIQLRRAVHRD